MTARATIALLLAATASLAGCMPGMKAEPPLPPSGDGETPYVVVLGTAQDGGLPQIGCFDECCAAAREDPARRRLVTSLLLVDPRSGGRWLFDAGPDLAEQVERARGHPANRAEGPGRPPLFDGVFLTHAHMGHYTGLFQLGAEAYGEREVPAFVTPRMAAFLEGNDPWRRMVERGTLRLFRMTSGEPVALAADLTVTAFPVPHRDEFSDTAAFLIRGPHGAVLYLPDADHWETMRPSVEELIHSVDVALLDGTFYSGGELEGRNLADVPHPFLLDSIERFSALPPEQRRKIRFTHLNHSNPAADPSSGEAAHVRALGLSVAREAERIDL